MIAQIVHEGRGGYMALAGLRYPIEHFQSGHFCIHYPGGNHRAKRATLLAHFQVLSDLAATQQPTWALENRSTTIG